MVTVACSPYSGTAGRFTGNDETSTTCVRDGCGVMWTVDELMANHGGLRVRGGYNVKYEVEIRRATGKFKVIRYVINRQ